MAEDTKKDKEKRDELKTYGRKKRLSIQIMYVVAMAAWIIIVAALGITPCTLASFLIVMLPIFVYAIGLWNAGSITSEVEESLFTANYLSIGMLLVLPLLTWINKHYCGDKNHLLKITVVAFVLSMLSIVDVWVPKKWLPFVKHLKSVLQTASLALLIYAVYEFFVSQCK